MTKNLKNDEVGDTKTPAIRFDANALSANAVQSQSIAANPSAKAARLLPEASIACAQASTEQDERLATSCRQRLWLSFFFDGTGNNVDADERSLKHSNVARLYRAHPDDNRANGTYRFYVPGVGTYFRAIGDDGGSSAGLGAGYMGRQRIDWALEQFDTTLVYHRSREVNPLNKIIEINVAVFGFSRGAALCRAFVNIFLSSRCKFNEEGKWVLGGGHHLVRIRFMGLFDTVASVGVPMSTNTTSIVGATTSSIRYIIRDRLKSGDHTDTLPINLAFDSDSRGGADPSPGFANGHDDWGALMQIPETVEEVRHFVAAHEIRNSFPVESVSVIKQGKVFKPPHFYETVYPGVHSDVGGSYRPGEGGRGAIPMEKLGLIPLRHMYHFAISQGVPLLVETAWRSYNRQDFEVGEPVVKLYNHYSAQVRTSASLGGLINAHLRLYFAWRFRSIRRKANGDNTEGEYIARSATSFRQDSVGLDKRIKALNDDHYAALKRTEYLEKKRYAHVNSSDRGPDFLFKLKLRDDELHEAIAIQKEKQDQLLKAKAERDTLPNMDGFQSCLNFYDEQLLRDATAIYNVYTYGDLRKGHGGRLTRNHLRPHYKVMMEAYENEYQRNDGLTDKNVIAFFDKLVHDSLAGFAKDATLPSDPRVVYLGGNEKYRYASLETPPTNGSVTAIV